MRAETEYASLQSGRWLKRILTVSTLAGLRESLGTIVDGLGFRYFDYRGRFPQIQTGRYEIRIDNCPAGWRKYCTELCSEAKSDPLRRRILQQVTPVFWRDFVQLHPDLYATARKFGLATGVTVPIHGPDGQWSALSFIKERDGSESEAEISEALPRCQLLSCFVHEAAARVIRNRFDSSTVTARKPDPSQMELSRREHQILSLVAAGKTISEITEILPISERTVVFHLSNARRKLGTHSSSRAIVKALSLGLIAAA